MYLRLIFKLMKKFYFFLSLLITNFSIAQIPTTGLINHWSFTGNANDAIGGNNGTVSNATLTPDRFGNPNCAYKFNGSTSYIVMASAGSTGTVSRSVSFWAKRSITSGLQCAFDYGTPGGIGSYHILFDYGCSGVGFDNGSTFQMRGNNNFTDNNWHHFVVVYDASISNQMNDMIYYVDGVLMSATVTCGGDNFINSGSVYPVTIGRTADAPSRHFTGDLDDFFFYNRALTPTEVLALYNTNSCLATPLSPSSISGNISVCAGSSVTYSVPSVAGATSYTWTLPGGWTGTSSTNTILVMAGTTPGQIAVVAGNCCGASQPVTLDVSVSQCTGIKEELSSAMQFIISPNPNKGTFAIQSDLNENSRLEIYNSLGQMVFSKQLEKEEKKIETKLPEGVYFVLIRKNDSVTGSQRLIITEQ